MEWDLDAQHLQREGRPEQGRAKTGKRLEWFRHNPRASWSHQKLEGATLKPLEGTSPADNLISDFWPAEPWETKYVLS